MVSGVVLIEQICERLVKMMPLSVPGIIRTTKVWDTQKEPETCKVVKILSQRGFITTSINCQHKMERKGVGARSDGQRGETVSMRGSKSDMLSVGTQTEKGVLVGRDLQKLQLKP